MTEPHTALHILLVEDDLDLRNSLTQYLTTAGIRVTGAGSCLECYALLATSRFQVAVVDVSLPDQSGLVMAEYLRANSDTKIIILTALERVEDRLKGYQAGAHNYFIKPVDCRELLAAILSLTTGDPAEPEKPASAMPENGAWQLRRKSWHLVPPAGEPLLLTSLELQLLELLALNPGRVVTRDTLLTGLYNRNDEHSGRALDSLIRRLRAKIVTCGHLSPIKTAHSVGFCFSAPILLS